MDELAHAGRDQLHLTSIAPGAARLLPGGLMPSPATSFIGRQAEIATVADLLRRPNVRLVTLTGPGGVGKTRLALQVAAAFAEGLVFVDLSPLAGPRLVAPTIAQALAIRETATQSVADRVLDVLRTSALLVVLDNFEHVVDAAPYVAAMIDAAPGITILVTSRISLRLSAERVVAVPPLSLATDALAADPLNADAMRLFEDRAQAARSDFALTEANVEAVTGIVRRLDGLPLAIELAASRMAFLSPATLLARLDQRLPLLTGGARDTPARQRTLRDTIAWSYDLLEPGDRALFRRLSVFPDSFTLDAAEAVCGTSQAHAGDVVNGIASLVATSLLQADAPAGISRYRMLETIREFARDALERSGEAAAMTAAHGTYYLDLAEDHDAADPFGGRVLPDLEQEHANLRTALAWFDQQGDHEVLTRFSTALCQFWIGLGHYHEGRHWLTRALSGHQLTAANRARAHIARGVVGIYLGSERDAEADLLAGLQECRRQGDTFHTARALIGLGAIATAQGDYGRGSLLLDECFAVASDLTEPLLQKAIEGWALINLAAIDRATEHHALAEARLTAALKRMRDAACVPGIIMSLGDLGDVARDRGDHVVAQAMYRDAVSLGQDRPATPLITYLIESVGVVSVAMGQAERGSRLLGAAGSMRERSGLRHWVTENQVALEHALTAARDDLGDETFAAALAAGRNLEPAEAVAEALAPLEFPSISLTRRELEVLTLVADGLSNPAIAGTLFLSVRTVENHVAHITAKFGVTTRAAAVDAARRTGHLPERSTPPT